MRMPFLPRRRRGVEILDEAGVAPALRVRSLRDVARANALFGGRRAALAELERALPRLGPAGILLDVGTGLADIPAGAVALARRHGVELVTVGLDSAVELLAAAPRELTGRVCASAFRLPFADRSVDIVICSQLLHHFVDADAVRVLRELHRVARHRVIVSDLRRSWTAAAGFWLASWPLRFHPITRHDGTLSVLRGFTTGELAALVREAVGQSACLQRWAGWRLTASWSPEAA